MTNYEIMFIVKTTMESENIKKTIDKKIIRIVFLLFLFILSTPFLYYILLGQNL